MQIIQAVGISIWNWLSVNKDAQGKTCPQLFCCALLKMQFSISSSATGIL